MSWQDQAASVLRSHVPPGSRLLAAVSGGPDSVALAHFLRGQPYSIIIGHVDHALRRGSAQDARFVERLARLWDLPSCVARVDVKGYGRCHHLGIEEAARDLRYRALAAMAAKNRCAAIVTAHSADDQAETVLMNFLRGAGPGGLAGMPAARRLKGSVQSLIVRPFLGVRKKQILQYLRLHSLSYRRDPTNDSLNFSRNRIRHHTLPYLEKRAPGLSDRLIHMADVFRAEEDFWRGRLAGKFRKTVRRDGRRYTVVLARLLGYHKALSRRILRHALPGLSFQDIEQVLTLARSPQRTAWLKLSGPWLARRTNKTMVVQPKRTG